jgi:Tfp pilus assembly protein PilF
LHGARLNISTELVRVSDSTQLWGDKYERALDDVQQMESQLATTIAQTLRRRVSGDEKVRLARAETSDPEAYRLYLKGREFLVGTDAEMDKSVDFFQQAVTRAPDYAMAYAGLADVYTVQAFLGSSGRTEAAEKARAAATRALELDPNLGEVHSALAGILFLFEWDWARADAEFRRGIDLSPGSESVHEAYGSFLNAMGRLDEGLAESREAARLDPLSVQPFHDMAINALLRSEFEKAATGFRHTIEIDPDWTWGYIKLARSLALEKKCNEAFVQAEIAEHRIAGGVGALSRAWLGATYATCGDVTRARQKLADCTPSKQRDTSIRRLSQISTPASVRSTRPCIGIRRPTKTGHRVWFTRKSPVDSIRNLPPMPATAQSWRKRFFSSDAMCDPVVAASARQAASPRPITSRNSAKSAREAMVSTTISSAWPASRHVRTAACWGGSKISASTSLGIRNR